MEVLAGVEAARVDPLHLHHEADGAGVGHVEGGAGAHVVDNLVVLELLGKLLGHATLGALRGGLGEVKDLVKAVNHGIVVLVALGLVKDLDSQGNDVAHLLDLGGVVKLKAVHDGVVGLFGEGGAGGVGHGHDGGATGLGGVVGLDGLGRGPAKRAGDDKRGLVNPGRRVLVELACGVVERTKHLGGIAQEVVARVELGAGGAAADEGDALDVMAGDDLGDDLLDVGKVDGVVRHGSRVLSCLHCLRLGPCAMRRKGAIDGC